MDEKEVEKLVKEAEANRESDKLKKESIEARNHADSAIYQTKRLSKTMRENTTQKDGEDAKAKIEELKKFLSQLMHPRLILMQNSIHFKRLWWKLVRQSTHKAQQMRRLQMTRKMTMETVDAEVEEK